MTRLLVASRNRKKLAEMRRLLDAVGLSGISLVSLDDVEWFDEAPETGATFEDNALAKARAAFGATGLPSVADDSGLQVDAHPPVDHADADRGDRARQRSRI